MVPKLVKLTETEFARLIRRAYLAPRLIVYGKVRALTQGGAGSKTEIFSPNGSKIRKP